MKFLIRQRLEPPNRRLLGCIALIVAYFLFALSAGLLEPRTVPVEGYIPHPFAAITVTAAAICFLFVGVLHRWALPIPWPIAAVGIISLFWIPTVPVMIGAGCWTVALLLLVTERRWALFQVWRQAALCTGLVIFSLGALDHAYELFGSYVRVDGFVSAIARLLPSVHPAGESGSIIVDLSNRSLQSSMTIEKFGGIVMYAVALNFLILAAIYRLHWLSILKNALLGSGYAILVSVYMVASNSGHLEYNPYDELNIALRYLPLIIFLSIAAFRERRIRNSGAASSFRYAAAGGAALLALWFMTVTSTGSRIRSGEVIIDEYHSSWEPSDVPLNESLYGSLSVYSYTNLVQELKRVYNVRTAVTELTEADLIRASVLILKTPTSPYSHRFCDLVEKFVRNGGGLWLISDHTDAFGMSTNLNAIASRFGCRFEKNAWFEPMVKRNLWQASPFTEPYMRGIGTFLFYTGCQIDAPFTFAKVAVARRQLFEDADYAAGSFFGKLRFIPQNKGGNALMACSGAVGRGKVSLWSDSTLFSNFAIYMPGKLATAVNTIQWLRTDSNSAFATLRVPGLLICILVVVLLVGHLGLGQLAIIGLMLQPLMLRLSDRQRWYDERELRGDSFVAVYEPTRSWHFPVYAAIDEPGPDFYLTTFVALQRANARPFIVDSIGDLRRANLCVWVPQFDAVTEENLLTLGQWVKSGGSLAILDAARVGPTRFGQIARAFGLGQIQLLTKPRWVSIADLNGRAMGETTIGATMRGGIRSMEIVGEHLSVGAVFSFGKGHIFLSSTVNLFADSSVGNVHFVPKADQRRILEQIFRIVHRSNANTTSWRKDESKLASSL